ncbi:T9SS type A sorting domain-containing protein [Lewinella sp. LCG006]|uniref:T9SS type A sorting domain-containing protein n=1 Tax=Lewinella sp. LCG006 TaxID=3231911 RepID=UPI00345FB015
MKNVKCFFVFLCLLFFGVGMAQVPKVAFVGATRSGSSSEDGFTFVLGEDLAAGTTIFFTDEEYRSACDEFDSDNVCDSSNPGEPYIIYSVVAGGLTEGTVVLITETGTNVFTATTQGGASAGTATTPLSNTYSLAASDVLHAFDASDANDAFNTITEIYASIKFASGVFDGNNNGDNPIGNHPNAIVYSMEADNGEFTAALRDDTPVTREDLLNTSNWMTSGSAISLSLSPFTLGVDLTILPVEFTSFTAQIERESVLLQWQTAKEENNDYFQIEHSTDGRDFSILGRMEGSGTTNDFSNYSFLHEKPASGINYYRLRQIDYDGAFEYSQIASVRFDKNTSSVILSPNPFTTQVTLSLSAMDDNDGIDSPASLWVKNVHGQVVHQEIITNLQNHSLNLSTLAAGTYYLQIQQHGRSLATQRLVKI